MWAYWWTRNSSNMASGQNSSGANARPARSCPNLRGTMAATFTPHAASVCRTTVPALSFKQKLDLPRGEDGQIDVGRNGATDDRRRRGMGPRGPRPVDVVPQALEFGAAETQPGQAYCLTAAAHKAVPLFAVVVLHHRVPGLGKEQPALQEHTNDVRDYGEGRSKGRDQTATHTRGKKHKGDPSRQQAAKEERQAAQLGDMFRALRRHPISRVR